MQIEGIPTNGCNYINNNYSFTNYYNSTAKTYIIMEGRAVLQRTSTYTSLPTGYNCLQPNAFKWKSDFPVFAQFMSIILCTLIAGLLWKTLGRIIGR